MSSREQVTSGLKITILDRKCCHEVGTSLPVLKSQFSTGTDVFKWQRHYRFGNLNYRSHVKSSGWNISSVFSLVRCTNWLKQIPMLKSEWCSVLPRCHMTSMEYRSEDRPTRYIICLRSFIRQRAARLIVSPRDPSIFLRKAIRDIPTRFGIPVSRSKRSVPVPRRPLDDATRL